MTHAGKKPLILSSGIIPIRFFSGAPRYLLLRAYGYWDFPKGVVDPGEDPIDAAKRELEEETSIQGAVFSWGHEYRETEPYSYGKIARYYLAEVPAGEVRLPDNPVLGRPEHQEFRWCAYPEARALVSGRVRPILDWANSHL